MERKVTGRWEKRERMGKGEGEVREKSRGREERRIGKEGSP